MVVEETIILPIVSATWIPTTATATQPMMSNQTRATTPWPSSVPASANLFVTRTWPIPPKRKVAQPWQSIKWQNHIFQNLKVPQQGK